MQQRKSRQPQSTRHACAQDRCQQFWADLREADLGVATPMAVLLKRMVGLNSFPETGASSRKALQGSLAARSIQLILSARPVLWTATPNVVGKLEAIGTSIAAALI
jgi:hypothetical protein